MFDDISGKKWQAQEKAIKMDHVVNIRAVEARKY